MKLSFTRRAEMDLEEIADYVAQDSPERALALVTGIRRRCSAICDFPNAARARPEILEDIRAVIHSTYLILYSVRDETVVVERIVHGARHLPSVVETS